MIVDKERDTEKNIGEGAEDNKCNESGSNVENERLNNYTDCRDGDTVSELEEKYKALERKFTYLYADFENYKRRAQEEKGRFLFYGLKNFILDILPVLDDLERAVSFTDDNAAKEWLAPIVYKFTHALSDHGVRKVETNNGDVYDEKIHNAVATSSSSNDEKRSDKSLIKDIIRNGYTLNDEVIRYVDVVV